MSNASDKTSCISHKPITHYFVMYEDFLEVAKVSEHRNKLAAFWRVLETKTNDRITYNEKIIEDAKTRGLPIPETNLWIEIPYSEFVKRSLGVYKSSSFQVAAAESERLGFHKSRTLTRKRNPLDPTSPPEDYKEYLLLTGVLQKALNEGEYPTPIEINSPLLKSIAVRKEEKRKRAIEKNTPPIEINSPPPIEINTPAIEINRIIESILLPFIKDEQNKVTDITPAFAERNAPSPISQLDSSLEDFVMRASFEDWIKHHPQHPPIDDVDNSITTPATQEDEHLQPSPIATGLATQPPTAEKANVSGALPKIEAQRETEALPDKQASSYSPGTSGKTTRSGKTAKETPVKPKPEITITAEALVIWGRWRSLFKKAMPLNDTDALAAELFISLDPSSEDLNNVRLFCYVSNPGWYGKYGKTHGRVTLRNVFDNWAGWVASLECPDMPEEPTTQQKHGAAKNAARVISSFDNPDYNMDGEFYPSEAERQAHARLGA